MSNARTWPPQQFVDDDAPRGHQQGGRLCLCDRTAIFLPLSLLYARTLHDAVRARYAFRPPAFTLMSTICLLFADDGTIERVIYYRVCRTPRPATPCRSQCSPPFPVRVPRTPTHRAHDYTQCRLQQTALLFAARARLVILTRLTDFRSRAHYGSVSVIATVANQRSSRIAQRKGTSLTHSMTAGEGCLGGAGPDVHVRRLDRPRRPRTGRPHYA